MWEFMQQLREVGRSTGATRAGLLAGQGRRVEVLRGSEESPRGADRRPSAAETNARLPSTHSTSIVAKGMLALTKDTD